MGFKFKSFVSHIVFLYFSFYFLSIFFYFYLMLEFLFQKNKGGRGGNFLFYF